MDKRNAIRNMEPLFSGPLFLFPFWICVSVQMVLLVHRDCFIQGDTGKAGAVVCHPILNSNLLSTRRYMIGYARMSARHVGAESCDCGCGYLLIYIGTDVNALLVPNTGM